MAGSRISFCLAEGCQPREEAAYAAELVREIRLKQAVRRDVGRVEAE